MEREKTPAEIRFDQAKVENRVVQHLEVEKDVFNGMGRVSKIRCLSRVLCCGLKEARTVLDTYEAMNKVAPFYTRG